MSHHLDSSADSTSEVAAVTTEDESRSHQPSEQTANASRQHPIWRCGAFAAEFADAVISNTDLEGGTIASGESPELLLQTPSSRVLRCCISLYLLFTLVSLFICVMVVHAPPQTPCRSGCIQRNGRTRVGKQRSRDAMDATCTQPRAAFGAFSTSYSRFWCDRRACNPYPQAVWTFNRCCEGFCQRLQ